MTGTAAASGTFAPGSVIVGGVEVGNLADATLSDTGAGAINAVGAILDTTGTSAGGLVINLAGTTTFSSGVIGSGGIKKEGTGTLTLSAGGSYSGGTTVNAGELRVTNTAGSATGTGGVTVNNSGTLLTGNGQISGPVTIGTNAVLAAGPTGATGSVGTLSLGALTLNDTTAIKFDLGMAEVAGGSNNDLITLAGALTLDGKLTLNNPTSLSNGRYTLFTYTGALTNNTLDVATSADGFVFSIDTSTTGSIFLDVSAVPEPSTWIAGGLLVGLAGWSQRKRIRIHTKSLKL